MSEVNTMKLWIDDVRPAPEGYVWCISVNWAKYWIKKGSYLNLKNQLVKDPVDLIDIDHDAGNSVTDGGDYIKLLDWMEEKGINNIAIHIHSMNPVGVQNMRRIIQKNGWKEV